MFKVMLFLHLLTAIFAIGPLVHAVTTASRGLRRSDPEAIAASSRMTKVYAGASILTVIFGFGLMSSTSPYTGKKVASFSEPWIWISLLLWLIAAGIAIAVVVPALDKASDAFTLAGAASAVDAEPTPSSAVARVAASGGVVGILMAVVVALMVWQPGH
ncbi:DUF2269 family protein [Branchiibius sp. NY16-3462-2]|uniref:DUF2269 family protein n=1 Tax=Branchiibius sp. NY16-3462-2 TaxID=1807500 RepID=UPI00079B0ACA|nr:DUF2269 family protein [Branchiibius sp. NY16-3462-2]KYH43576.1 hypothetical protein AZH51_03720 [Branchiibius sp. NY16-3462-2]